MSYEIYKFLHLLGLAAIAFSFGAFAMRSEDPSKKKLPSMVHGIGLVLALLGGFGMAAKLKLSVAAPWLIFKIVVWLGLGAFIAINKRKPDLVPKAQLILILLALAAAYLGVFHNSLGL